MLMKTLAQDFLVYLEAEKGYSPHTATAYCDDLRRFFDFLTAQGVALEVENVTTTLVRQWLVAMHHDRLSSATIGRRLYGLRSFWKYLVACEYVEENPVARVGVPKREQRLPKYLTADQLEKLLDAAQRNKFVICGFRNYALLSMFIFTGMRRGEVIGLRIGDVSFEDKLVRVRGKGTTTRVIPLVDRVLDAVSDWLELRPNHKSHDYLFTTTAGNRIWPWRMHRIWRRVLEDSGIESEDVTLHTLRHSMATLLLQSGECSLVEIQRILGHSRLDTTAIYLHVTEGELRDAVHAHPLAD